jgi:hypothetical protein
MTVEGGRSSSSIYALLTLLPNAKNQSFEFHFPLMGDKCMHFLREEFATIRNAGKKKKEPGCALDAPTKQRQPHALCDCTHHLMPHLQRYTIHNQEIFHIQESNQAHTGLIL